VLKNSKNIVLKSFSVVPSIGRKDATRPNPGFQGYKYSRKISEFYEIVFGTTVIIRSHLECGWRKKIIQTCITKACHVCFRSFDLLYTGQMQIINKWAAVVMRS